MNPDYKDEKTDSMIKKGLIVYDKKDAEYNEWFINHIISEGRNQNLEIRLALTEDVSEALSGGDCDVSYDGPCDGPCDKHCDGDIDGGNDLCSVNLDEYDFAIMRNRDWEMNKALEDRGIRCFNSSYVCRIGNDKWEMYQDFCKAGIPVMYTQKSKLPYPFVMKPKDGHGGNNVFLIKNAEEYDSVLEYIHENINKQIREQIYEHTNDDDRGIENYIYQFVASETGRDIRVYVVGDTILTAMERRAGSEEFRANFSLGGSASEYLLTEDELKLAAKTAKHIGADFVGIDIIYNNGKPIVNEIEDAVGTRMLYANTDIDAVKVYIDWIAKTVSP